MITSWVRDQVPTPTGQTPVLQWVDDVNGYDVLVGKQRPSPLPGSPAHAMGIAYLDIPTRTVHRKDPGELEWHTSPISVHSVDFTKREALLNGYIKATLEFCAQELGIRIEVLQNTDADDVGTL